MKAIMVSCNGDDVLRRALKIIAAERGVTVGALVRMAIQESVGGQVESLTSSFFAQSDAYVHQNAVAKYQETAHKTI